MTKFMIERNPSVSAFGALVASMTVAAIVAANPAYDSAALSAAVFVALGLSYVAIYARMVRHHWCSPIAFLLVKQFNNRKRSL